MQHITIPSIGEMLIALGAALKDGLQPTPFSSIQELLAALGSALEDELLPPTIPRIHAMHEARAPPPENLPADFVPLHLETRSHVTTAVMCRHLGRKNQTARAWASSENFPDGLRPLRVNGRLAWPVTGIRKLLGVAP